MPSTIREWMDSRYQEPLCIVYINKIRIQNVVSVDVNMGTDQQSSSANIRVAADAYPDTWETHTTIEIRFGFKGPGADTVRVFKGEVEDIDTQYLPYSIDIKAAGYLKRLQHNAGNTLNSGSPADVNNTPIITWNNATDSQIWEDCMRLAGITDYTAGNGDSRTIVGPINLLAGDNIRGVIDKLDQASESGQRTFEFAGHVYRMAALRVPLALPPYTYTEGEATAPILPVFSLERQRSDRDVKNQVIIQGQAVAGTDPNNIVAAVRQQVSEYWGSDGFGNPIYVPFNLTSEFLETRTQCDDVAQRYMYEHNKLTDVLTMRTPINPYARPAMSVGIISGRMGLADLTQYWVRQVNHHFGPDGANTDWTLEGGAGESGYLVGLPPIAAFDIKVTKEFYQVGIYDTPTGVFTVACDGSDSFDPDGTAITYAWSNNKNSDTGTGVLYATTFTEAQWADTETPPTITLTVTDSDTPDAHTGTSEQPVVDVTGTDARVIAMYVAAYGKAYATPDGWDTVNEWTPGAGHVISVCRIAAEGTNFFGLDNGQIWKTTDYLASTPTQVGWTAPGGSAVNAIWMSELDTNIVAVGLANGDFWITKDAFVTAPTLMRNFVNPVRWINGSSQSKTQWRATVGQDVWYTDDDFTHARSLVQFLGQTIVQTELTDFNNYASATGTEPLVKTEAGVTVAFPALSPSPVTAHMTAFIDTDTLLVGDDQGRSFISEPASLATTLVQKTSISYGAVNDMLRDNTNNAAAYAACETALAKTFDRATSWVRVLTFDGVTTRGLQLGYDSAPLTPPVELFNELVERTFQGYGTTAANAVKEFPPTDDPVGNKRAMDLWNPTKSQDENQARNDNPPTNWYQPANWPAVDAQYVSGGYTHYWRDGSHVAAQLTGGLSQFYDRAYGAWVKSESLGTYLPSGWGNVYSNPGWGRHAEALFLHRFTLPAMTIGRVVLSTHTNLVPTFPGPVYVPGVLLTEFYVNGTQVAGVDEFSNMTINPALFTADGTTWNYVAMRCRINVDNIYDRICYKLGFGSDANSVSLFETEAGKIVWSSSQEGAVAAFNAPDLPGNWYAVDATVPPIVGGATCYAWPPSDHYGLFSQPPWPTLHEHGTKLANMNGMYTPMKTFYIHGQVVDMPAGSDTAWYLYVRKWDYSKCQIDDIYINGSRLSTGTPASPTSDTGNNHDNPTGSVHIYRFNIPSGTITMGARNGIAFKVQTPGATGTENYSNNLAWYMVQV